MVSVGYMEILIGEEEIVTFRNWPAAADSSNLPDEFRQTLAFEASVYEADNTDDRKTQDQQSAQQNPTPWKYTNHSIVLDAERKSLSVEIQFENNLKP